MYQKENLLALQVLNTTKAFKLPVHQDHQSGTQRLAFFHAARENTSLRHFLRTESAKKIIMGTKLNKNPKPDQCDLI